jgi:hypothetical protein
VTAYPRHVLRAWQLIGDPNDDFANISIGDRQLAVLLQLRGDRGDFLSAKPPGEQSNQRHVILLGNPVRVTLP